MTKVIHLCIASLRPIDKTSQGGYVLQGGVFPNVSFSGRSSFPTPTSLSSFT